MACIVVILGGIYQICMGKGRGVPGFEGTTNEVGKIALAFYNGLWAYDGWVSVTLVTEEIKRPERYGHLNRNLIRFVYKNVI